MSIYTKKGDGGYTSTLSKNAVSKSNSIFDAIGNIDEANSFWGLAGAGSKNKKTKKIVDSISKDLFTIGAILAGADLFFTDEKTLFIEHEIDKIERNLKVVSNFILPGGCVSASFFHLARCATRRAERSLVGLSKYSNKKQILKYVNRLSDLAYVLARYENKIQKKSESVWNIK